MKREFRAEIEHAKTYPMGPFQCVKQQMQADYYQAIVRPTQELLARAAGNDLVKPWMLTHLAVSRPVGRLGWANVTWLLFEKKKFKT